MEINWFEIIVQMFNFLVLLLLLKKLLYKPVINAMDKRQQIITEALGSADEKMNEAMALIAAYEEKIADLKFQENDILNQAKKDASNLKDILLASYKDEANELRMHYFKEIDDEKENFFKQLRNSLGTSAVNIASNILAALTHQDIEDHAFDTFIEKIRSLDKDAISAGEQITIICAKDMPENKKRILEDTIEEMFSGHMNISYKTDTDMIIGYDLKSETFTLHANVNKYLDESANNIFQMLEKIQ